MHKRTMAGWLVAGALALGGATVAQAQTFASSEPVLQQIWQQGMQNSQTYRFAQALIDSVGPRLTGSPGLRAGNDWLVSVYRSLGIEARNQQYGTWRGWRRGITHVDLLTPRVRTLEGTMLAWSPPSAGTVQGGVTILPKATSRQEFEQWLTTVRGKFVLVSFPQPTCRPDNHWQQNATAETFQRMQQERNAAQQAWSARTDSANTGVRRPRDLHRLIERAGALAILTNNWSEGWGVDKIFAANTQNVPAINLSCEDYGLVFRLAENGDNPTIRLQAESENLGEVPVFNTIASLRGTQLPNEYVMLSAHFDSWDSSGGATDNGTGTIVMLEAMRILKQVYPNPKRTILVGHWAGEEQGLNGSRAFAADHPEIVRGLQVLFNQDNGTGRVVNIGLQGLVKAGDVFNPWFARLPKEISQQINVTTGRPSGGGSDNASFVCLPYSAPAFGLSSTQFDYGTYTWHTNRDTFDKISFDDLKNNATLAAMLVYMASEDPQRVSRDRIDLATAPVPAGRGGGGGGRSGGPPTWPNCQEAQRNSTNYFR